MVRITEDLVRKKSEHNEKEITTLEELSLHQEDIEKIEHLQNWCRDLQILLLQSNLISKIENLWKLKKLQYLNLALNNIERIENLERLESLEKLDLTLNFIGELSSVQNLKENYNLNCLYLTGNPCTDYKGYREYVITVLPQIKQLDSVEIERSERIIALQDFDDYERSILREERKYLAKREAEKSGAGDIPDDSSSDDGSIPDMTEEEIKEFWDAPSKNTPEDRLQLAKMSRKIRRMKRSKEERKEKPRPLKLFTSDGRPLNINQARIKYTMSDDDETGCKVLDVAVYRFLDTSLIDVDLHPKYVTIKIKGKVLQLTFNEEVEVDKSTCQRSQTTGHLVVTMPLVNAVIKPKKVEKKKEEKIIGPPSYSLPSKREYLEIGPASDEMDFSKIMEHSIQDKQRKSQPTVKENPEEKIPPPDFVDDDEVPPLE